MTNRSKQRRSTRSRVHTLLRDVFLCVGPEVFVLCTLSTSISKLATVSLENIIPELRRWWKAVSQPRGLTETARELCEASSINSLMAPNQKRQHSKTTIDAEQTVSQNKRARLCESDQERFSQEDQDTDTGCPHALTQIISQPPERPSQGDQDTDTECPHALTQVISQSLNKDLLQEDHVTVPAPSVLDLKITVLLSFLEQYQASCPDLQMICPLSGVPSPFIEIKSDSSLELDAKIEFSLQSSKTLMEYIFASRAAAAEVSH